MSSPTLSGQHNGLTMDLRSLDRLKTASGQNAASQSTIKETARQLEGLFMQELMKSMRATTMSSGMLDNSGTEMGTSMLDTQLAQQMAGLPRGLSELIERQLSRQMGVSPEAAPANLPLNRTLEARLPRQTLTAATRLDSIESNPGRKLNPAESFVRKHQAAADAAERATGIPAANILGQAALESGWGKREIRANDGSNSHNLFGIKATANWKGKVAEVTTTEYIGGVARKVTAKFRAYDSYEDAFKDHGRLLSQSPRYSQAVAQADSVRAYAQGLQRGGYATDPAYADKLTQVINTALRLQQRSA
ncbi:MAG: flagellar assembly peptidoglycan hydrolase FlgJ [Aquabacterium sp.]|jgi:flagellar protein FlgJ|uniref:flagellar assembly peptidoglycan hydrolase FlgJ n=1 Tax=Aquabacterium sp. TaxID=1872578 RepID=UPI001B5B9AEB|nr:flagellar assembly peptidoglycan hydrolase FlgJ [Aquabacterium sp.]MBP7132833.1 flagellar assembly peptidoglycan hydrolase FlgJ [Aquabacterium sp.]MBP9062902.1 flagellar assembly peptidoglycan hydrolase FlgJ [Aquabacterium sp.]MDQ5926420.1 peptidoglycan hydrolase FlgJ [Pseudomonadota bacterium]